MRDTSRGHVLFGSGRNNLAPRDLIQMTSRQMTLRNGPQNRLLDPAAIEDKRAARMKAAP